MSKLNSNDYIQTTLGELVSKEKKSIISGPFGSNIGKIFFRSEGIPVIRGNNLSTGGEKFKDDGFVFISREKADELNCYAIKNDVIFTAVGTIGQVGIIDEKLKFDEYVISNKQLRVRFDNNKITPLFAYYWFSSYWIQKLILQRNVGSTVPLINLSVIKGLPINLPKSIKVQNGIVEVLENISLKIELNNRINAELEAMAKTLYDYWFVQFDFPNAEGKPYKSSGGAMVWSEELKIDIPQDWTVNKLDSVVRILRGASPRPIQDFLSDEGMAWVKISDATATDNRFITETKQNIIEEGISKSRFVSPDTLILSNSASPAIPRIMKINACVHDGWLIIDKYKNGLTNEYMYHYFEKERPNILKLGSGSIFKNLKTEYLKEIEMVIPSQSVLESLMPNLKSISEKIYITTKENQQLAHLRDWLLPMLMNGQVVVE